MRLLALACGLFSFSTVFPAYYTSWASRIDVLWLLGSVVGFADHVSADLRVLVRVLAR